MADDGARRRDGAYLTDEVRLLRVRSSASITKDGNERWSVLVEDCLDLDAQVARLTQEQARKMRVITPMTDAQVAKERRRAAMAMEGVQVSA